MMLSRTSRTLSALRLIARTLWPPLPEPVPAAIYYYESALEDRRAR